MRLGLKTALLTLCIAAPSCPAVSRKQDKPADQSAAAEEAQPPKSIAESVSRNLVYAEGDFLSIAEAMPDDKYSFVPSAGKFDGVRSFAEQVKHVACAQFAFFNEFEGKKPPADCEKGGDDPARTKTELIQYLKDSFDYGNHVVATLNERNALDRIDGRYAGPNTKLGISVVAVWHITDHYGQIVEYLRMNGIAPPMTQKYGLKVR
ncbi:MAG TPA: DinB family protein [Terriglobales bacterium]|nr:DinB family protein [Terriglobales bacterium]